MRTLGLTPAGPVGPGNRFDQVSVGIVEVNATAVIPVVDLAELPAKRIRPIVEPARANALEDGIEFRFVGQKREVTLQDFLVSLDEVQRSRADLKNGEMPQLPSRCESQQFGEKPRGLLRIVRMNNSVIEGDRHSLAP
jgi:hypothetical protein